MAPLRQEDDYYFERPIERRTVSIPEKAKEQKPKVKRNRINKKVILSISVFGVALSIVYRYAMINNMNMENIKLKKELNEINNMNAQIQLVTERSINLKEVQRYAEENLGLQKPQSYQIEYINVNREDLIDNKVNTENKNWFKEIVYNVIKFFN